jgi:hypothetical protein
MSESKLTIDRERRDCLYELVRNHLGAIGDFLLAFERKQDRATAERLGLEVAVDFRLLGDTAGPRAIRTRATCRRCQPTS